MKKLTLNIEKNVGYIYAEGKKRKAYKTIEINEDILVDVSSDGNIVGIELLNANEQLGIKYKNSYLYPANLIDKLTCQVRERI